MSSRNRRGKLETATESYTKDGRTVTLLGTVHIATHEYWRRHQERINAAESAGMEIHYESVKDDRAEKVKIMPDYRKVADFLGLQDQKSGLNYSSDWKRTDLTFTEMFSGTSDSEKMQRESNEFEDLMVEIRESGNHHRFVKVARWMIRLAPTLSRIPLGFGGAKYGTIIGKRNQCALEAIAETDADVLAIWGAAHVRGIGKALRHQGWTLVTREWDVAL